jgi:hypothetical protein
LPDEPLRGLGGHGDREAEEARAGVAQWEPPQFQAATAHHLARRASSDLFSAVLTALIRLRPRNAF